jgi:hypothetical protein
MTPEMKKQFPGGVDTVTSGDFVRLWRARFEHFAGGAQHAEGEATGEQYAANVPKPQPKPPLSPAMEEMRRRIERGDMKLENSPVPYQPYQVPGENLG